jgi:lipoate-protein ligase A
MIALPYNLPDAELIDGSSTGFMVWQPRYPALVLGQSNQLAKSLNPDAVVDDGISVYRRPSGGETVMLDPETLVISVAFDTDGFKNPGEYFRQINAILIDALNPLIKGELVQRGISDISCGDKKILGSSIYRKRNRVLYHAVLNVSMKVEVLERYIAHPPREPDYRKGRPHKDFVTSLSELGYAGTAVELQSLLQKNLEQALLKIKM